MRAQIVTLLALLTTSISLGQTGVAFHHLGSATFQNTYQNPALIPSGDLFIGLPVLSGVHFHINNKTSYRQTFTTENNSTVIDIKKMLGNLQNQNLLSAQVGLNLLHVGFKTKNKHLLSFSVRERVEADLLYSKQLVDFLWNGNEKYVNQEINVANAGVKAMHFREFGFGYALPVEGRMKLGMRAKFLMGFADVSLPANFSAQLESSGEAFQLEADWKNFAFRTSGLDIYNGKEGSIGSHLLFNRNLGAAIDLGITYSLSRAYTVTASILDLGFINWRENIKTDAINDTTFNYGGVALDELGTIRRGLYDSLFAKFNTTRNNEPYMGLLPAQLYAGWIYHYSRNMDIYVTGGARMIQRKMKMLYGVGVTQKFGKVFTGNLTATKLPQQFVNLGASFAVKGGPVQMYMAADRVVSFSVPDAKAFDFRMGINLVLNTGNGSSDDELFRGRGVSLGNAKGMSTGTFLGKRVKTKKREGIYSIIKKQRKREARNIRTTKDTSVRKKSLNGKRGKKNTDN